MALSLTLRKLLHRPAFEQCNPTPSASAAGSFAKAFQQICYGISVGFLCVNTTSAVYEYQPEGDACLTLPASGIAGTFGAGATGRITGNGPSGTASGGTTTAVNTALTIPRDLRGFHIRITSGPGAGDERIIKSNTLGANSVITVTSAFSAAITAASSFQLLTPRFWVLNPAATPGLGYYDWALGAWTAGRSVSGLTHAGTDGQLVSTDSLRGNINDSSDSAGNAAITSSTVNSFTLAATATGNSGRNWVVNQWAGAIVQIIAGTGAGQTRHIVSNTATSVTVGANWAVNPDATSVWLITKAFASSGSNSAAFSAAAATTLTLTGVNWTVNQWTNYQIRIVAGTGAGQIRSIASNTATQLTVSAAWTTNPDATSIWVIEGNDDYLYFAGNNAVTLFRYSISGNAWSTLTPGVARAGAPGAGMSLNWICGVNDVGWNTENAIKNGRYLYSFRGANGNILDYYDLAANSWTSAVAYAGQLEAFNTGTNWEYLYNQDIVCAQLATGRFYTFDLIKNELRPAGAHAISQGAAIVGDRCFAFYQVDGSVTIPILYHWCNTSQYLMRMLCWHLI